MHRKDDRFPLANPSAAPAGGDVRYPFGYPGVKSIRFRMAPGLRIDQNGVGGSLTDDQLFAGSIADNICFFSDSPDFSWIEECAQLAAVHDDIVAMPMGYETLVSDMGSTLSGGQKQCALIARALYRQPSILLLDEATSHLDITREKAVNAAIRCRPVTRIIIAHRPETIRSADRIITLNQGKVVPGDDRLLGLDHNLEVLLER